ncbi:hypothetical protein RSJ8_41 [Clostridium botulinum]|nr:hypothetical protein NPD2_2875 [Clostridium botulinum]APC83876.1 hypothetical protein NPD12_729 [Clostridium botulinum]APH23171.1 hypothetical protein NPD1_1912 [Clostridium botulinum]APQ69180.1 hypothetical protein RSJ8_41 [Clostridium botulinum]APQ78335.1 hypothetical protein RSJ10_781 [Clostridium botulinum]
MYNKILIYVELEINVSYISTLHGTLNNIERKNDYF